MNQTKPRVIIGLGNPGSAYTNTRHNIGFRVVDALAHHYAAQWRSKDKQLITEVTIGDVPVILIKPQTSMNSSGQVIPSLLKKGITAQQILVVHDELELPFGKIVIKSGGSAKGHNGLKSIIASSGPDFMRLRIGIDRPDDRAQVPDYVLSNFKEASSLIDQIIDQAVSLIISLY